MQMKKALFNFRDWEGSDERAQQAILVWGWGNTGMQILELFSGQMI